MEQNIDPDNDVNPFLSAFIFMAVNGFHEAADPFVTLCKTTAVEHQIWGSPLKDMAHGPAGKTRLMHAAKIGDVERARWLIERRAALVSWQGKIPSCGRVRTVTRRSLACSSITEQTSTLRRLTMV
jgi:hypothetical protein